MMITGDALLDFGDFRQTRYACPPVIRRYFPRYPYKVSSDYALAAKCIKAGYAFKKTQWPSDAKKVQRQILHVHGFWAKLFTPTYYLKDESLI